MIPVIKIGNDFNLRLIVRRGDGTAEDFDGVEKIEVQAVKNGAAWVTVLPNSYYYGIDGIVVANFVADDTLQEGEYRAKVKYTKDGRRYLAENCQAFLLTTCCSQLSTDTAESIDVTLSVQFSADGKDGLSAYELAVANGDYTGDYSGYQKWLASLAGEVSVESANGYTDGKLIPINKYLDSIKNNIVKKNGDIEIKANDAVTPATAEVYVNQNYLNLTVGNKGIHIDGSDTEFIGHHPRVEDGDILPYSKDSSRITTCKNIEQKFNNFDFIRTVSDPNVTDENAGGKIYNEIRVTNDGHQLDIAVYSVEGVNRGEHNVDQAVTRIEMNSYGDIKIVSTKGKIRIESPSILLDSKDARYNPKNFASSQNIINRKYADCRFIYWCELYMTHFANYEAFNNWLSSAKMSNEMPTLVLAKLDDAGSVCVFLGEMVNDSFVESRLVYSVNYFLFHNVEDNESGIRDADNDALQHGKLYRFECSREDEDTYKATCDINPVYSNRTEALDNLAKGSGVLMGSVFWNIGLQSVDTRYIDLDNISAGEKSGKISIPDASSTTRGFMSSADKIKLAGINTDGSIYRGLFEAAGAIYNEETKYYELNGLTDITEEEMLKIYLYYSPKYFHSYSGAFYGMNVRTCFKVKLRRGVDISFFFENSTIEVVDMDNMGWYASNFNGAFLGAKNLSKIIGVIYLSQIKSASSINNNPFAQCLALKDVKISGLSINIYLGDSPLLTQESISYLVDNAANTSAITVQIHPDVYAKLTDSTNTDWYAVNTAAQDKQISFATTDAQAAAISLMNAEEPAIIQETRGELTEIAAPAGYYMTQAGDTDGRMYFTRKVLVEEDSVGNYRLATAEEYEVYKIEQQNNLYNG